MKRPSAPPVEHSKEWLTAFQQALADPGIRARLWRYALHRASVVRRYRAVGDEYAQDLLQNAIGDTFRGVLAWDPTQVDLERHLWNAIRARSHCDYKRAKRFRHERAEIGDSKLSHLEAHDVQREELRQRARCVLVELRELAADDPIVLLLLAAYEEGVIHRGPVLEHTGITPHQYEAARDRLARLRDDLPHHLAP